jgi:hypothetical protein
LSQVGRHALTDRVEYVHDVHQAPLDQSKSSIVVLAITSGNRDVFLEASEPPRHLLALASLHEVCITHALPPRRPRRRVGGANEHHLTERALFFPEQSKRGLTNTDAVGEGVMDRFKHDQAGTIYLVVARIDEPDVAA